jgi:hypothetical protein
MKAFLHPLPLDSTGLAWAPKNKKMGGRGHPALHVGDARAGIDARKTLKLTGSNNTNN